MTTPDSPQPWYQFSLRSLFLVGFLVAVLCSLGVCTHWLISIAIGLGVVLGGTVGRILVGTPQGFIQGATNGLVCSLFTVILSFFILGVESAPQSWLNWMVLGVFAGIGGLIGGYLTDRTP